VKNSKASTSSIRTSRDSDDFEDNDMPHPMEKAKNKSHIQLYRSKTILQNQKITPKQKSFILGGDLTKSMRQSKKSLFNKSQSRIGQKRNS
jgi:hypothetical protein